MTTRTLDARPSRNPLRLTRYPLATAITGLTPRSYTWKCGIVLDQGVEGACVGHAWAHEAAARPVVVKDWRSSKDAQRFAFDLYHWARRNDPWEGENYDGTDIDSGARGMREEGLLPEWRWTSDTTELSVWVGRRGPAVLGIPMYTGMMQPDSGGFLRPTGIIEGWHAILVNGFNLPGATHRLHNSWGRGWGINGEALMHDGDLRGVLAQGEACIPVRRHL